MKKGKYTLVTNHAMVLAYLARHPKPSTQEIAQEIGLSVRGVSKIIIDLGESGYLSWQRQGRRNRYIVNPIILPQHHLKRNRLEADTLKTIISLSKSTQDGDKDQATVPTSTNGNRRKS